MALLRYLYDNKSSSFLITGSMEIPSLKSISGGSV